MTLNPWRRQGPLDLAELARLLPAPGWAVSSGSCRARGAWHRIWPRRRGTRVRPAQGRPSALPWARSTAGRANSRAWPRRPARLAVPAAATPAGTGGGEQTGSPDEVTGYGEADPAAKARVDSFVRAAPGQPAPEALQPRDTAAVRAPNCGSGAGPSPARSLRPWTAAPVRPDGRSTVCPGEPGTCGDLGLPGLPQGTRRVFAPGERRLGNIGLRRCIESA